MTLARFFASLRKEADMSLRELCRKARPALDPTTAWKIEHGLPIRAQSLAGLLRAMGLNERDEAYVTAFALWASEQAKTFTADRMEAGITLETRRNDRSFAKALNRASAALRKVPETDWNVLLTALEHPEALKLWMQSADLIGKK